MRRPHRSFGKGPKRQVTWAGPADQAYVAVAGNTKVLVASFTPSGAGMEKPTLIRTRGQVSVKPQASSADLELAGAIGIGVVSDQALTIGITAIPGPFTDADWDGWAMWRSFAHSFELQDATASLLFDWSFEVDSKGMRKLSENESLVFVAESQSGAFEIAAPLRTLFKLA